MSQPVEDSGLMSRIYNKQQNEEEIKRITTRNKIGFACAGPPSQLMLTSVGFFFGGVFLLEVAQISPAKVTIIVFSGRVWDALTDPVVGYFVSMTQAKQPSLRKWVIYSLPLLVISYMLLWAVPPFPEVGLVAFYTVVYLFFQTAFTSITVPMATIIMYITNHQPDRDTTMAIRMTMEAFSVILSVAIVSVVVMLIGESQQVECAMAADALAQVSPAILTSWRVAYLVAAAWISLVTMGFVFLFYFLSDETQYYQECNDPIEHASFKSFLLNFVEAFKFKPFQILSSSAMFLFLGLQQAQTNLILYFKIVLQRLDSYSWYLLGALVTGVLTIPLWQLLLLKVKKKDAYTIGCTVLATPLLAMMFITHKTSDWVVIPGVVVAGVGIGSAYLYPWSMLPDVIADYNRTTEKRIDGLFYSVFVFFQKLAMGLAAGASQIVMSNSGYQNQMCYQSAETVLALRILMAIVPVFFIVIAIVIIRFYELQQPTYTEKKLEAAKEAKKLEKDKQPLVPDQTG